MSTYKFTRIAMGVALATASLSALAAPPSHPAKPGAESIINAEYASVAPTFDNAQLAGLALLESVASLMATYTQDFGCSGTFNLSITTVDSDGIVDADISGANTSATLEAVLRNKTDIGARVDVANLGGDLINGKAVNYRGAHGWSPSREIFNSDAWIKFVDDQTGSTNYYREVDIKDYFKRVINGKAWEFDSGLEDVKKKRVLTAPPVAASGLEEAWPTEPAGWSTNGAGFYYPVQKWHELSWFSHENGDFGALKLSKYKVIPRNSRGCRVLIEAVPGTVINGNGVFEAEATIKLYRNSVVDL